MRTVDPELWYKNVKKPGIQVTRNMKYGQKVGTGWEGLIRASFMDAMREFRSTCSVRAVVRVGTMEDNWQKSFYIMVLVVVLCVGLSVIGYDLVVLGNTPPLLVSLQPSQRAALHVHFPAVALCSTKIFSAKALEKYIKSLDSRDINRTYTEEEIRRNLLNFGALLNRATPPAPIDVMFTRFLMRAQPRFNLTDFFIKVTPPCSLMLRRCSWRGHLMPCDRLFSTRITQLGYCCVFNSRYQPEDVNTEPKTLNLVGKDLGLTFFVQNNDDFIYSRRPSVGYEILLFEGSEYPLMEGGGVRTYPVEPDAAMFMAVKARVEKPSSTLDYYNEEWRGCRLRDDSSVKSWRSSYAWCLSDCRRHAVAALCSCAPHNLPPDPEADPVPLCTTDHLPCLNKHREKFLYYYPGEQSAQWSLALGEELQDALECLHCAPDCARILYSATVAYSHDQYPDKIFQNFVARGVRLENCSSVRVYYMSEHKHRLYLVEGFMRWYEAAAFLASEWVSVMGVSMCIAIELLFYCIVRWPHHCRRRARERREDKIS